MDNPKIIFDWMKSKSESSRRAWERRWESGSAPVGPKGAEYLEQQKTGGGGGYDEEYDYEGPVWEDAYEWSY